MSTPVPSDPTPQASTPEPVLKAAALYGTIVSVVVPLLGALVATGVLTSEQADAINSLSDYVGANIVPVGVALVSGFGLITGIGASFATAAVARRKVTPVVERKVVD